MDSETGENAIDRETGEVPEMGQLDSETGEIQLLRKQPDIKKPFKVPVRYIRVQKDEEKTIVKKTMYTDNSAFSLALLFLLPSLFVFMPIMALFLAVVEMILHNWAHRKNQILRNNNINHIYYQSPMHIYVSQFCGTCRYELSKEAIGKLHDKLNRRFIKYGIEYVKQVV